MRRARPATRTRWTESGQAGIEVLPFGLLTFVVGALLVANAWAVIDAKLAVSAAAREATRAFVEAPADTDPLDALFARCETVRFEASYRIPAIRVPWIGGFGDGIFTASARHSEVVDPFRDDVPFADQTQAVQC